MLLLLIFELTFLTLVLYEETTDWSQTKKADVFGCYESFCSQPMDFMAKCGIHIPHTCLFSQGQIVTLYHMEGNSISRVPGSLVSRKDIFHAFMPSEPTSEEDIVAVLLLNEDGRLG